MLPILVYSKSYFQKIAVDPNRNYEDISGMRGITWAQLLLHMKTREGGEAPA